MKKKTIAPQMLVSTNAMAKIHQLLDCITKDKAELAKLFPKVIAEADKKLVSVNKLLVKAKKSVLQAKKNRAKSPENYDAMVSLLQSLKKDSPAVKLEQATLKAEFKRFQAKEKVCAQVEKTFLKASKKVKTKVKKTHSSSPVN